MCLCEGIDYVGRQVASKHRCWHLKTRDNGVLSRTGGRVEPRGTDGAELKGPPFDLTNVLQAFRCKATYFLYWINILFLYLVQLLVIQKGEKKIICIYSE